MWNRPQLELGQKPQTLNINTVNQDQNHSQIELCGNPGALVHNRMDVAVDYSVVLLSQKSYQRDINSLSSKSHILGGNEVWSRRRESTSIINP